MIYHNYPALKSSKDREALWDGLRSGVLDVASSDDFTIPFASKISGVKVDNALGGHNGIETRMGYMFSEGVKKGQISVDRSVDVSSTAVAKIFGTLSSKGGDRHRQRCGHRSDRSQPETEGRAGRSAFQLRLQHLGRLGIRGRSRDDDVAGQRTRRGRRWTGTERNRPVRFLAFAGAAMIKPSRIRSNAVAIERAVLEYERRDAIGAEQRDAVVMLHPWYGCVRFWDRTVEALPEYETFAVDLYSLGARGLGKIRQPSRIVARRRSFRRRDAPRKVQRDRQLDGRHRRAGARLASRRPISKLILVGTGARIVGVKPDWRKAMDRWIAGEADRTVTERMVSALLARRPNDPA